MNRHIDECATKCCGQHPKVMVVDKMDMYGGSCVQVLCLACGRETEVDDTNDKEVGINEWNFRKEQHLESLYRLSTDRIELEDAEVLLKELREMAILLTKEELIDFLEKKRFDIQCAIHIQNP